MSKFKVGDKVLVLTWRTAASPPITVKSVIEISTPDGHSFAYQIDGFRPFYTEDSLAPAPTKKRYEIIRVVEAENEEQARQLAESSTSSYELQAREIK
jgi:hypothetical protein